MSIRSLPFNIEEVRRIKIDFNAGSDPDDNTVIAAVAGKKFIVLQFVLSTNTTATIEFQSDTGGTALTGDMTVTSSKNLHGVYNPIGHFETVAGELLNIHTTGSASVQVSGYINYLETV